jgi:hypothetical protein
MLRYRFKMATKKKTRKSSNWGGARPGAGRKPGPNPKVSHRVRAEHDARHPVLVTLKRANGLPSLRSPRLLRVVRAAVEETPRVDLRGFRIVLFAVGAAQVDFVVEAEDREALGSGIRSISIRVARRANIALDRTGHIWGDRYRSRVLTTAAEVRDVVARVLGKAKETAEPPRTALLR